MNTLRYLYRVDIGPERWNKNVYDVSRVLPATGVRIFSTGNGPRQTPEGISTKTQIRLRVCTYGRDMCAFERDPVPP